MSEPVLSVRGLRTEYPTHAGTVIAVRDVSFDVAKGEVLGLVGESGSGKTVTGFSIMGLLETPGRIAQGEILFHGRNLADLPPREMRSLRGNRIAMIFQDPMMTLNPVLRIDTQIIETILAHEKMSRRAAWEKARDALGEVGIPEPEARLSAYPHQFSGGMRQRVAIAIALLHKPELLIADEPTTALDVTIQAQILSIVQRLVAQYGTSLIWITHDLSIVSQISDRIAVMYAGRFVELGAAGQVIATPHHPYTSGLIGSIPSANARGQPLTQIRGTTPSVLNLPTGCPFRTRCDHADEACLQEPPMAPDPAHPSHRFRCLHPLAVGVPLELEPS
ncbi:ABC transporter ATP-binding protein [Marinovum sp.]|uniref:ABC transporter ATP-binding protein n=1 Tax=Marinovum sp. TaxID=2024839 RepID=UPI002B279976|nr:ABC transporter ATP-binding protein [Marinovum sp.]